jgi:hypothetical protein
MKKVEPAFRISQQRGIENCVCAGQKARPLGRFDLINATSERFRTKNVPSHNLQCQIQELQFLIKVKSLTESVCPSHDKAV